MIKKLMRTTVPAFIMAICVLFTGCGVSESNYTKAIERSDNYTCEVTLDFEGESFYTIVKVANNELEIYTDSSFDISKSDGDEYRIYAKKMYDVDRSDYYYFTRSFYTSSGSKEYDSGWENTYIYYNSNSAMDNLFLEYYEQLLYANVFFKIKYYDLTAYDKTLVLKDNLNFYSDAYCDGRLYSAEITLKGSKLDTCTATIETEEMSTVTYKFSDFGTTEIDMII